VLPIALGLVGVTVLLVLYGARRWAAGTRVLLARLEAARSSVTPATYDAREPAVGDCRWRPGLGGSNPARLPGGGAQRCRVEYCDTLETERREQPGTQSRSTHWRHPLYSTPFMTLAPMLVPPLAPLLRHRLPSAARPHTNTNETTAIPRELPELFLRFSPIATPCPM
jgi:hypothetical protein